MDSEEGNLFQECSQEKLGKEGGSRVRVRSQVKSSIALEARGLASYTLYQSSVVLTPSQGGGATY